mgnify:CR=1 FL=1
MLNFLIKKFTRMDWYWGTNALFVKAAIEVGELMNEGIKELEN